MIDHCAWDNPGADPYRGTASEWVARLPAEQRGQVAHLLTFVQNRDYDAIVYIDKDGITPADGKRTHTYENRVEYMAFGSKGTICKTTSRKWDASQMESAMLFCGGGNICVARWSICNNYSIVYREPVPTTNLPPVGMLPPEVPVDGGGTVPGYPSDAPPGIGLVGPEPPPSFNPPPEPPVYWPPSYGYPTPGGWYYPPSYPPCAGCAPTPGVLTPIPEPSTWLALLVGFPFLLWAKRRLI
jgi:hypothetical protein